MTVVSSIGSAALPGLYDEEWTRSQAALAGPRTDTLAESVLILLTLTVVQRMVGFLRSVVFCRWLDAQELGLWDMAHGFLMLAAPAVVLGLPGSFGRYVEHYRRHGQLRTFFRCTLSVIVCLQMLAVLGVSLASCQVSLLIFGSGEHAGLVRVLALGLGALIAQNALISLFTAMRMFRVVSVMQFSQTMTFALLGCGLLAGCQPAAIYVAAAFGAACCLSSAGGLVWLRRAWPALPQSAASMSERRLWARLMPFALWVWAGTWLSNLFDLTDRYLIIHYSGLEAAEALWQVGQYHSSRVIPLLLLGMGELLAAIAIPHLAHDWESGRRELVSRRLTVLIKLLSFVFTAASAAVLLAAPWLFEVALAGKYAGGLAVLPGTLIYATWAALAAATINYLWCAEKARLASLTLLVGLMINVSLNLVLLPRWGLSGVVAATAAGHLTVLVLLLYACRVNELELDFGVWLAAALPMLNWLGPNV
ncbi:MAG: lipopolysaccharide biosynthesis protein, partial [Pirellulales bacterium]